MPEVAVRVVTLLDDFLCFLWPLPPLFLLFLLRRLTSTSSELELLLDSEASDELDELLLSYFFLDFPIGPVRVCPRSIAA